MLIRDFAFEPKVSEECVQAAFDWVERTKSSFTARANFAILHGDGKNYKECLRQPCHNFFSSLTGPRDLIVNENATGRRWDTPPKGVSEFLKWFTEESIFSRFFLNGDRGFENCFIISSDVPYPLVQNMNIIGRHFWEASEQAFALFKDLLDLGYSGDVAYGFCFNTNIANSENNGSVNKFDMEKSQIYPASGHRAWALWYSLESFHNFLRGEMGKAFEKDCEPSRHFRRACGTVGGAAYCDNFYNKGQDVISEVLAEYPDCRRRLVEFRKEKKGEEIPKIKNPFIRKNTFTDQTNVPNKVFVQELTEVILPFMREVNLLNVN